jgi:KaiC/GvpD/RAD55 family RecA-like ATPase
MLLSESLKWRMPSFQVRHPAPMSQPTTSTDPIAHAVPARLATASGSNVAVVGEPMVGKSGVALDALEAAADAGRDTLLISAARGPGRMPVPDSVSVVDCTPGPESEDAVSVNSPADLTGIGMPVSKVLGDADRPVVAVDSLTSLLLYNETREAFRFFSVLSTQVASANGLGMYLVDDGAHDERTVQTFAQLFDGQVELRSGLGGTEARGRGVETLPAEWLPARS